MSNHTLHVVRSQNNKHIKFVQTIKIHQNVYYPTPTYGDYLRRLDVISTVKQKYIKYKLMTHT